MNVQSLYKKLITTGEEASKLYNEKIKYLGEWCNTKNKGSIFIVDNLEREKFNLKNKEPLKSLINKINDLYYELLYQSDRENFFFYGASPKVLNLWVDQNSKFKINPTEGYDEDDFFDECISHYDSVLNALNSDEAFIDPFRKQEAFHFLLNTKNKSIVRRNLIKAKAYIESIKEEKTNNLYENANKILIPKEKIMYLNELGIIDFLFNTGENINPYKLGKLLEPLVEEKRDSLRKSISSLKTESFDQHHPYSSEKNIEKVKQLLAIKNWSKKK
ncbi:hypothetical protein VDP25_06900 [Winogradskyella sp. ECml5-4]|uniref:hypothetical protein n=1 Tax=Winogradskyella sp. ECml5-4 TaxID=3110975 RepID=UPI002FF3B0E7